MLLVAIKGPTFNDAQEQIKKALLYADLVELRLDCFTQLDIRALKALCACFSIPMIFTLRSHNQGGSYTASEEQRLLDIRSLASLKPEYLDLEHNIQTDFIQEISSQYPEIKLILSYHNFLETPKDLEGLYQKMRQTPAHFYKIAATANNCLDAMYLLSWAKNIKNLIAISMGPHGEFSRILGPIIGCLITYAALEEAQQSAPGQLPAQILIDKYRHRSLTPHTKICGLIGDPVEQSISAETHNDLIKTLSLNAVYVKIQVSPSELSPFLQLAKQLPFHGLSVTMPLKEPILPLLDDIDPEALKIGAVNTLLFEKSRIFGYNTDGMGALNALETLSTVKNKRTLIIGAGGAAKAIAYEAIKRGALVTILNRDEKRAHQLAERLHCIGKGLCHIKEDSYDIIINSTPVPLPIPADDIPPNSLAMDIKTKPKETLFLKHAKEKGCILVYGYQMFIEQALGQFSLWFQIDIPKSRAILEKNAIKFLR